MPAAFLRDAATPAIKCKPSLRVQAHLASIEAIDPNDRESLRIEWIVLVPDLARRDYNSSSGVSLDKCLDLIADALPSSDIAQFVQAIKYGAPDVSVGGVKG